MWKRRLPVIAEPWPSPANPCLWRTWATPGHTQDLGLPWVVREAQKSLTALFMDIELLGYINIYCSDSINRRILFEISSQKFGQTKSRGKKMCLADLDSLRLPESESELRISSKSLSRALQNWMALRVRNCISIHMYYVFWNLCQGRCTWHFGAVAVVAATSNANARVFEIPVIADLPIYIFPVNLPCKLVLEA